jgi:hypothetical protein
MQTGKELTPEKLVRKEFATEFTKSTDIRDIVDL